MKARVTKAFDGAPDGEHHPKRFKVGDTVEGRLAEVAVGQKWAEEVKETGDKSARPASNA